jgi:hypothetical protein
VRGPDRIMIPHPDTVSVIAGRWGHNIIEDGDPLLVRPSPHGSPGANHDRMAEGAADPPARD